MPDHVGRILRDVEALQHDARRLLSEYRQVCAEAAAPLVAALHRLVDGSPDEPFSVHEFAKRVDAVPAALLQDARRAVWWRRPFPDEPAEGVRQEDPDLEARAVGRARGAGLVRVHRLVAPGTVDEWIGEGAG